VDDDEFSRGTATYVQFDEVDAQGQGVAERRQGVLRREGRSAAMGVNLQPGGLAGISLERSLTLVSMPTRCLADKVTARSFGRRHGAHSTRRVPVALFAACVAVGVLSGVSSAVASPGSTVTASIDPKTGRIEGRMTWTFVNETDIEVPDLLLFAYPEIYRVDPDLQDILMERVYPGAFDAGMQTASDATIALGDAVSTPVEIVAETSPTGVPLLRVALPAPLLPGEEVVLEFGFHTRVPRKYGGFGRFRRTLVMNGGLAPLPVQRSDAGWLVDAPPPRRPRRLILDIPEDWSGVVGGVVLAPHEPPRNVTTARTAPSVIVDVVPAAQTRFQLVDLQVGDGTRRIEVASEGARWATIALNRGRGSVVESMPLDSGRSLTYVGRPLRRIQKRWVRWAASHAERTLRDVGLPISTRGIVIVEAPLRRKLVEWGDGVILLSDRFLEVERPFWRFMDVHLARALLADGIEDALERTETPRRLPLTLDGISWALVPRYLERRWRRSVNLRKLLEQFDFIPQVDDLLQTPVYPFADQIFDNPHIVDPLRADVRRFNRPLRSGRVLFLRLQDHIGDQSLEQAVLAHLQTPGEGDLYSLLTARSGVRVEPIADAWLGPIPRANLSLDPLVRRRTEDGSYETTVTLRRDRLEGDGDAHPTEILLKGPRKRRITLVWDGKGDVATWTVVTDHPIRTALLDPRGRVLEIDRDALAIKYDNRRPRTIDVTAWGYVLGAAVTGTTIVAKAGVNFRPQRDLRHRFSTEVFHDERARVGGSLAYTRYFGKPRIGAYRRHRLIGAFDFSWLETTFVATNAPLLAEARMTYRYDDRRWSFKPTKGGFVQASVFVGKDFTLKNDGARSIGESGYVGFDVSGSYLFRLHPWHILGFRARYGAILGNVQHSLFSLGGQGNVRGLPADWVVGGVRTMVTVEWRHTFIRDLDVYIPWLLSRLRSVRGALFVEAGVVADTIRDLPKEGQRAIAIGYGVRLFVDWFGFLPGMFGVDIAWTPGAPKGLWPTSARPEDWAQVPFQVYLIGTQSF
jgi:hypothetical protein